MEKIIPCPICQIAMQHAGNFSIYYCPTNEIVFSKLKTSLEITHAHVYLDNLGQQVYAKIIAAEYCFDIYTKRIDESSQLPEADPIPRTVIKVLKKINRPTWNQTPGMTFNFDIATSDQFEFVELLTINSAVSLPWGDDSKVRDAVKTYLTFS